jgi:hypothetical protein
MVISDVIKYKNKIMNQLVQNQDVLTLINNPNISTDNPEKLTKENLFPRIKIPDTTTTVKNYICFDYNSKENKYNDIYKTVIINMVVLCHKDEINTIWGSRHDVLGGVLVDMFNWSNLLGFQLELTIDKESIWEKDYYARELQFTNTVSNSMKNGVKRYGI